MLLDHAPQGRAHRTVLGIAATATLLAGVLAVPSAGTARPRSAQQCAPGAEELCLTEAQLTAVDTRAAVPGIDEIVSSPNVRQVANIPKLAPLDGANTDWAFQGRYAFAGNYNGFTVYDIKKPREPKVVTQVLCPGAQNDVSVHGDLLFLSVDSQRTDDSCNSLSSATAPAPGARWEGIRVFDISSPRNPVYIKSVNTACGSHTHTLVPGARGDKSVYLYVSSYNLTGASVPNCALPHDQISIVKVPLNNPRRAAVVATPVLFPDGGFPGDPDSSPTTGCHDITAYPEKNLAAGACMGDGVLFDIADRTAPKVITTVRDTENFAFWHSATFNNDATKVVFTDELGGGGAATCNPTVGPEKGADAVYDVVGTGAGRRLEFRSYFKIPRTNADTENCVAHNGSLIPVAGRDIMVQAWYQGGISIWDFTDSRKPFEIGFWERGPLSVEPSGGGSWSAYWYNGFVFSNDIVKGLDVLEITDPRTDSARTVRAKVFNAQTQTRYRDR